MPSCKRCGASVYWDSDRKTESRKKIDRRTENDYKHQAYINSVKEASEKALKESQNLSLPKVYTQIPDLPLKRIDSEVISTIVEHSKKKSEELLLMSRFGVLS